MSSLRTNILRVLLPLLLGGILLLQHGLESWVSAAWLVGGLCAGMALLWFDEHIAYPKYRTMEGETVDLVSRSTLFLLIYIPLSLFILTSSGSLLGIGLIVGLGFGLALEMLALKNNLPGFKERFLQQLKRDPSPQEIHWIATFFSVWVMIISVLAVW